MKSHVFKASGRANIAVLLLPFQYNLVIGIPFSCALDPSASSIPTSFRLLPLYPHQSTNILLFFLLLT